MKILALVTDAFGGRGGIAQLNRDVLGALAAAPEVDELTVLPRLVPDDPAPLPAGLRFVRRAARGKATYIVEALGEARRTRYDVVLCGHLNLLPLAAWIAGRTGARLLLVVYGIEAWQHAGLLRTHLLRRVHTVISISAFTKSRFLRWAPVPADRVVVIPCCVDATRFGIAPPRPDLQARYGLAGRTVLMTLARLAGAERYKGFDEIMALLPRLATTVPDIAYLIVGGGPDRARLERKAVDLGVSGRVVFAGYIDESEKADHYRLTDLFVMPGRGEGFGIVYLEAMACGIPVVASSADASRETVLDGRAGEVVDPDDLDDIHAGILRGLSDQPKEHGAALEYFSPGELGRRWRALLARVADGAISVRCANTPAKRTAGACARDFPSRS